MHKGVGVGIELLIQLSPRPTPFSGREDDASPNNFVKSIFEHLLKFCDWSRPSPPLLKINAAILAFSLSAIGIGGEKNTDGADQNRSSVGLAVIGLMMLICGIWTTGGHPVASAASVLTVPHGISM